MKKIFRISALLMILPLVATSCFKNEEDDIFDNSAAERLNEASSEYAKILTDKGGKWAMEYFASESMQGFVYVMTFRPNGTVTISGENPYIGAVITGNGQTSMAYGSADSQWDIIRDNGPVLSFSSYNKYFHLFSTPEDILGSAFGTGLSGRGYEGDYEFTLMKYSNDTLYIDGKKRALSMIMTRLPEDTDDRTYLDEIVAEKGKYFSSKIPRVFVAYPNGERHVMTGASNLVMTVYDEKSEDPLTTSFSANAIISHSSFSFMHPLTFGECSAQHFLPQEDGSLLCLDDNKTTISAGDLSKDCFTDTLQEWTADVKAFSGSIKAALDELNSQLPKVNNFQRYIQSVGFGYVKYPLQKLTISITVQITKQSKLPLVFYYEPSFPAADQLKLTMIGDDGGQMTAAYLESFSGMRNLLEQLTTPTFKFTTSSRLAPVEMLMSDASNAENSLVVKAK